MTKKRWIPCGASLPVTLLVLCAASTVSGNTFASPDSVPSTGDGSAPAARPAMAQHIGSIDYQFKHHPYRQKKTVRRRFTAHQFNPSDKLPGNHYSNQLNRLERDSDTAPAAAEEVIVFDASFTGEANISSIVPQPGDEDTTEEDAESSGSGSRRLVHITDPVPVLAVAQQLADALHHLAEDELGVSQLQSLLQDRSPSNMQHEDNTSEDLDMVSASVRQRLSQYTRLVGDMAAAAGNSSRTNHLYTHHTYNPCCLLPDHILMYDSRYGCAVNTDLWCDSGYGTGDNMDAMSFYTPPPLALTHMFVSNARQHPELKWQYFLSGSGLHTEFPAHRTDVYFYSR